MNPLLLIHIVGGGLGIVSGAAALAVRKGSRLHRASGGAFVAAMLAMSAAAIVLALSLPDWSNLPGGLLAFYLVATGWAALRPNRPAGRWVAHGGLVVGGGAAATAVLLAFQAHASATGLINGKPAPMFAIAAAVATFAVVLDMSVLRPDDAPRARRLGRHIWRMCTALFFGTGSFFIGQPQVFPPWMQGSPILFGLALAPLALMAFWMLRNAIGRPAPGLAPAA